MFVMPRKTTIDFEQNEDVLNVVISFHDINKVGIINNNNNK